MFRLACTQWKKYITDSGVWSAIAFFILLFTSAIIFYNDTNYDQYSVLTSVLTFDRPFMMQHIEFSSVCILQKCGTGWLTMFAPMIAPYVSVKLLCTEYDSGMLRLEVIRSNRFKYHLIDYLNAVLNGGILMAISFWIYGIAVYAGFPEFNSFPAELQNNHIEFYGAIYGVSFQKSFWIVLFEKMILMFFYGMVTSVPAILLTSFTHNIYTSLCLPFFFNYAFMQFTLKLQTLSTLRIIHLIMPGALLQLTVPKELMISCLIRVFCLLLFTGLYLLVQCNKEDAGG